MVVCGLTAEEAAGSMTMRSDSETRGTLSDSLAAMESRKAVLGGLLMWFVVALGVGLSGKFRYAPPLLVAATVWGLVVFTLILFWTVRAVRSFALRLQVRHLLGFNLIRLVGLVLIYLYSVGRLPASFGLVGGIGDCIVAVSAAMLLCVPRWQQGMPLFAWNFFGFADIVGVVTSALREGLRDPLAMEPLRQFPLNLLPLFFVPLISASHFLIFHSHRQQPQR